MKISVIATDEKNWKVLVLAKQRFEKKHPGALAQLERLPKEIVEQRIRRKLNIYNAEGDVLRYGAYLVPRLLPVEPLAWSVGGAFLSEDGTKAVGYLDSPATVEVIRRYVEMFYPLEVTPFQDVGRETWISCFFHHKMAMYFDANWTVKPMRPEHREQFGVVMPPRMGDSPYRSIVQVYGYGISSGTADVDLAWAFLQELASPHTETGKEWAKYNLAVTRTLAASSGQLSDPLYSPFLEELNNARLGAFDVSSLKLWEFWNNDIFQDWISRGGRVNLEERLSRIARVYEDYLQKEQKNWVPNGNSDGIYSYSSRTSYSAPIAGENSVIGPVTIHQPVDWCQ